jgi:glycosyltransferase involved in cell wall biosynthesis
MDLLPRLAYFGDVPVRSISAGPAVLYRLFEGWPADRLLLVEEAAGAPDPSHQLPGVRTLRHRVIHPRLIRSRLAGFYGSWLLLTCGRHAHALARILRESGIEAVVSLAHGYCWIPAERAARMAGLPFHLIVHDHWRDSIAVPPWLSARADRLFLAAYRQAASRLVISPAMEEKYRRAYGRPGTVLYPSRGRDARVLADPPLKPMRPGNAVFAYAGGVGRWTRRALATFADSTAPLGVRLRVYQGISVESLRAEGYRGDSIDIAPFIPAAELHRDLAARVDAMYLPMSFDPSDRSNVEVCFPSKLADYTVPGLPILVHAPPYGTASRWAAENDPAAETVTVEDPGALAAAVKRLVEDPDRRSLLARRALELGCQFFSPERAFDTFHRAVASRPARGSGLIFRGE